MRQFFLLFLSAAALFGQSQLRLSSATVGPINIVQGQNGSVQSVDAANIGSGNLSLSASSTVSWINATINNTSHSCNIAASCISVQMALQTASLSAGIYTGLVTVSDPNAIDAPQTISVTVQVGGGVPGSIDMYLQPGGSASTTFTAGALATSVSSPGSGLTLAVTALGGGSLSFTQSYQVSASAPSGAAPNNYSGQIKVTSSSFAPEVKNVPVTLHVTTQPIAVLSATSLQYSITQGSPKFDKWIQMTNAGQGTLTVSGATISSGASWLTAASSSSCQVPACVDLTSDPTGLSPGAYKAAVTIATNAANGPFTIPVEMDVAATGAPTLYYQSAVDIALYKKGDPVAPGDLVLLNGDQLTAGAAVFASSVPLGNSLGGATVLVNGTQAPIDYVLPSQVLNPGGALTFQIPYGTPAGQATIQVIRDSQSSNKISVQIGSAVPRLLVFNVPSLPSLNGYAIATFPDLVTFPVPTTPGLPSRPASVGDTLVFYAIGLGGTSPAVDSGAPAPTSPLANVPNCTAMFGQTNAISQGIEATPGYCGLTPTAVGLYNINVTIPPGVPSGSQVPVSITVNGQHSNFGFIAIQ